MPKNYNFAALEKKWQRYWQQKKIYEPNFKNAKRPFYNLMMFPYPSAEGLHIGSVRTFTGIDIYGRMKRMQGYDVFEPMGLDGFGIHSENFALKIGRHPFAHAKISEKNFYRQLRMIGNGFAWRERLETYDPTYYKWTQWIFVQLFKQGLAYRKKQAVNWCPSCLTVLADEQVIAGKCERCNSVVEKKELEQWFFRITKYAERLLKNLEKRNFDWPEPIKIAQRNWIGKSEGAEIKFDIKTNSRRAALPSVPVFTTRPDTLFGATYLVLSPEYVARSGIAGQAMNRKEAEDYVKKAQMKPEDERIAGGKEKTGVELKGVKAVNPANKEEIPVWVADYVLGSYGTGAIMAVPAHDERDFAFAEKYKLPIQQVVRPVFKPENKRSDSVRRDTISGFVRSRDGKKVLMIKWKKYEWLTGVVGGIEEGESSAAAAEREVLEETGYKARAVFVSPITIESHYFADHKNEWRSRVDHPVLLELESDDPRAISKEEASKHEAQWIAVEEVLQMKMFKNNKTALELALGIVTAYTGARYDEYPVLVNSGEFTGLDCESSKWKIVDFVGGKKKIQFRLRDWLISRQRYWGAPIPMVFCRACATKQKGERKDMPGWWTVPEKQLPVKLPFVKDFRPKGKGVSPLASAKSFYETRCLSCKGKARRETDVSDTFLDSAWYFLRYPSAHDKKRPWNPAITKHWLPVHSYIGGAEHAVLHLLYARFVTMAMKDAEHVRFEEPFARFRTHGLIIKGGTKMSKSKGNVVNPDEYFAKFGADVMRMYLAFLAPLEHGGDFRDEGILGVKRFLDRVWRMGMQVANRVGRKPTKPAATQPASQELACAVHKTIKKVTEDIDALHHNTAISALMILLNAMEARRAEITRAQWGVFLKLLAPFAPHLAEELWHTALKKKTSIHCEAWPKHNSRLIVEETITLVIQVNGKTRHSIETPRYITEQEATARALKEPRVHAHTGGAQPKRVIFVPGRLINIVV